MKQYAEDMFNVNLKNRVASGIMESCKYGFNAIIFHPVVEDLTLKLKECCVF